MGPRREGDGADVGHVGHGPRAAGFGGADGQKRGGPSSASGHAGDRLRPRTGRVDPRIARSRERILRAALAELGEAGYGAFAIESVAARAGVGKSTIYRHWPDKVALIGAAFHTLHEELGPGLDLGRGTARARAARIVGHVAEVVVSSAFSRAIPAMVDAAERDTGLRAFHHGFQQSARQPLVDILAEGVCSGELAPDLDPELAAFALLGPVFFCRLMTGAPFPPDRAGELLAMVLGPARPG